MKTLRDKDGTNKSFGDYVKKKRKKKDKFAYEDGGERINRGLSAFKKAMGKTPAISDRDTNVNSGREAIDTFANKAYGARKGPLEVKPKRMNGYEEWQTKELNVIARRHLKNYKGTIKIHGPV